LLSRGDIVESGIKHNKPKPQEGVSLIGTFQNCI